MLIDINIHAFDPPDPDLTYAHYLETCRRVGVTRAPRGGTGIVDFRC